MTLSLGKWWGRMESNHLLPALRHGPLDHEPERGAPFGAFSNARDLPVRYSPVRNMVEAGGIEPPCRNSVSRSLYVIMSRFISQ